MSTAVWSYVPTESVVEEIHAGARGIQWGGRPAVWTATTSNQLRRFTLSFGPCTTSAECNSMLAFFRARNGAFDPFVWQSPIDSRTYQVRFDSSLRADLFTPGLFRSGGQLAFITTHTPTITTVVGTIGITEFYPGSGGGPPPNGGDPTSGTGTPPAAYLFPDAWYWAGLDHEPTFASPNDLTSNRLHLQPFAITQSGFVIDALGTAIASIAVGSQCAYLGLYASGGSSESSAYDAYPLTLLATTSVSFVASGMATNLITPTALAPGVYWVGMVTSFTGAGTRFRALTRLSGLWTGLSSLSLGDANTFFTAHSLNLPTTCPRSATQASPNPTLFYHVASQAP